MHQEPISIVVPAHNESAVIRDTLASLGSEPVIPELIIACNGCADDTATVARAADPHAIVLESSVPSKTAALNIGDATASHFPRFYIDADIRVSPGALTLVARRMRETGKPIASPRPVMDFEGCSRAVRAYYAVWLALPYVRDGLMGTGVYALSEQGRQRFAEFPQVIADDGYVRALFAPSERLLVTDCHVLVRAPRNLANLIKIKTRSRLGVYELQMKYPELALQVAPGTGGLAFVARRPSLWVAALVYLSVNLYTRRRAKRMARERGFDVWERDDSRRAPSDG
jgi:glycosyltransferase involved in cell wall biosynthesis